MSGRSYRKTNILVRATIVLLLVFIVFSTVNMQIQLKGLRERKASLEKEIIEVQDDIDELTVRIVEAKEMSDEYIARVAIEKLGFRYKGEIVFYNDVAD